MDFSFKIGIVCALTEAADELSEVYERVCVVVQQTEDAQGQVIGVCAAGPGEEQRKQHFELLQIDAVLLQVRQARVVPAHGVTGAAPVTAGQMLSLRVINHAQVMTLVLDTQWMFKCGCTCDRQCSRLLCFICFTVSQTHMCFDC